jgi:hypothetical protein
MALRLRLRLRLRRETLGYELRVKNDELELLFVNSRFLILSQPKP